MIKQNLYITTNLLLSPTSSLLIVLRQSYLMKYLLILSLSISWYQVFFSRLAKEMKKADVRELALIICLKMLHKCKKN